MRQKAYLLAALADFCVVAEDMEEEGDGSGESEGQSVTVFILGGLIEWAGSSHPLS